MMPLEEFERQLSEVKLVDDFAEIIVRFINSIEDPTLKSLAILEVMSLRFDDEKTKAQS